MRTRSYPDPTGPFRISTAELFLSRRQRANVRMLYRAKRRQASMTPAGAARPIVRIVAGQLARDYDRKNRAAR